MINVNQEKCARCGGCVSVCPFMALTLTEHGIECDKEKCTSCATCTKFCPVMALSLKKEGE